MKEDQGNVNKNKTWIAVLVLGKVGLMWKSIDRGIFLNVNFLPRQFNNHATLSPTALKYTELKVIEL